MLMLLYQALGALALLALLALAPLAPALRRGLAQRLGGAAGAGPLPGAAPAETIWIHAASVGEVRAAEPLVAALLRERPAARLLVSTFTTSGRRLAEQVLAAGNPRVRCRLAPLDWGWIPARVVRRERPDLFVLLETEIWPVLLRALGRARVPVLLVNGRLSDRSARRYRALRSALVPALAVVERALVRTREDARRFAAIGVPAARIRVAGNLKHARRPGGDAAGRARRAAIGARLGAGRPTLVAGSVRGPEGLLALAALRRLLPEHPGLLLVLAPRHPDRFDAGALREWGGAWVRWSAAPERIPAATAVVLLDTIGELPDFYAAAAVACVGGTWADRGGHNLLEPAFHGVPVVFGPDYRHFDDEGRALLAAGGGFVAADGEELYRCWQRLLGDPAARDAAGRAAASVAETFGGALEQALAAVREVLGPPPGGTAA
jgi:3-deoxy-D-manno-octulosonic-acid transferase